MKYEMEKIIKIKLCKTVEYGFIDPKHKNTDTKNRIVMLAKLFD